MRKLNGVALAVGIMLVLIGIGLFVDALGIFDFGRMLSMYWPVLLLVVGLVGMFTESSELGYTMITIFAAFKCAEVFLGKKISVWDIFVPVLLILIGISIIKKNTK